MGMKTRDGNYDGDIMRFSIIIAAYNVEQFISAAVDSVLNQTLSDCFEVVIVDDGSTDRTGEICDAYADSHECVVVVHKSNGGLYEARKSGARAACGQYLLFLDGDDYLRNDALAVIDRGLRASSADMLLFRMCRNEVFDDDACSRFHAPWRVGHNGGLEIGDLRTQLLTSDTINNIVLKVLNSSCLSDFLAESEERRVLMAEDKLISSFALDNAKSAVFIDEVLYYYRPNESSIMKRSFNEARFDDLCVVHQLLEKRLYEWGMDENSGKFYALLVSQTCEELSSLYASNVSAEDRLEFLSRVRSSGVFVKACEKADMRNLSTHRRITYRALCSGNPAIMNLWMAIYNFGMAAASRVRGR